ncbi:MAG TPA: MFS transporter [Dehalococcoidia bacterium]|nr:MFS transporter [Dehalococcoidia bacterium]
MADPGRDGSLALLRDGNFRIYIASRFCSTMAMTLLAAAISWQVFEISDSALQLGLIGVARFLPSLGLTLVGGAAADSYDRRRIVLTAEIGLMLVALSLMTMTFSGSESLPLIYGLVILNASFSAFEQPARLAVLPSLVSRDRLPRAISIASAINSFAFVSGPAAAGVIIALASVGEAYAANVLLIGLSFVGWLLLRVPGMTESRRITLQGVKEGVKFVWQRQALLGCMTLDMFAVIFGGAQALLPIYATEILDVGPLGFGILSASLEAGALLMAVALVFLPPINQAGRALLITVAVFGLATIVFGLSRSFALSLVAYMAVGMADQLSVVMRHTIIQLSTPDEIRGRVSSVSMLFINASNQLGAAESGLVAAATSATFAVVSGGIAVLAVAGAVAARMPDLRRYRSSENEVAPPTALAEAEQAPTPAG